MPENNTRRSGILLPIHSLPSAHGIGGLGRAAYDFVDFLAAAGQSLWQILPIGHTGFGDSPYQCFSAFAGNPYFIDLDLLAANGLLLPEELPADSAPEPGPAKKNKKAAPGKAATPLVDYGSLYKTRFALLAKAMRRFNKTDADYLTFCRENEDWLDDYALFMALKEAHGGAAFSQWPEEERLRDKTALRKTMAQHGPRFEFWKCVQYHFFRQWAPLKAYANARGIQIVGDIPIYISPDSADLWARPELFLLDETGAPTAVAGVPPDLFSKDGQLWGNPLYDWDVHRATGYAWWVRRLRQAAALFDITRIDHFRGFAGYYAVPAGHKTARKGTWEPGPGKAFIARVKKALPHMQIIAEDLGVITPDVRELLDYAGYPGMKVLQFAFSPEFESDYLPHNFPRHTVAYTGTHDNETTAGWAVRPRAKEVKFARHYLAVPAAGDLCAAMVRAAMASHANDVVIPLQDWLSLGDEARTNTPSTLGGNWRWRLAPGQCTPALARHIYAQTALYFRLSAAEKARLAKDKLYSERKAVGLVMNREETRAAELAAAESGTSHAQLMERAGSGAATALLAPGGKKQRAKKVLILCGKGNNAGDAFVMAAALASAGWCVSYVPLCGEEYSLLAEKYRALLPTAVQKVSICDADFDSDIIIDAVFGTGFKQCGDGLPAGIGLAFRTANAAHALRVALDIPSGLDCDTGLAAPDTFRADITYTFGAYKPGLLTEEGRAAAGDVQVVDIGLGRCPAGR